MNSIIVINFLILAFIRFMISTRSNLLSWIFFIYFTVYIVLLPALYNNGFSTITIENDLKNIHIIIFSNFIFSIILMISFIIMNFLFRESINIYTYDIIKIRSKKLLLPFIVLFTITYMLNSYIFSNPLYFIIQNNAFESTQNLKRGGWFILVAAGAFYYFYLLYLFKVLNENKTYPIINVIISSVALMIIMQYSSRTAILLPILVSIIFFYEYKKRLLIHIFNLKWLCLGFLSLSSLVILDKVRQGLPIDTGLLSIIFSTDLLQTLLGSFLQLENGLVLVDYFNKHDFLGLQNFFLVLSGYSLLPSFALPFDKIDTGVEAILTTILFGENLNPVFYQPNSTLTFSIPFTGYAEYGYVGVVLHSIMYSFLLSFSIIRYKKETFLSLVYLMFSLQTILAYRLSIEAVINSLYVYIFFISFTLVLYKITYKNNSLFRKLT